MGNEKGREIGIQMHCGVIQKTTWVVLLDAGEEVCS